MNSKNILFLNWKDVKNPTVGGAEVIAFNLARRLVADGHHVTLFCRKFPNCLPQEIMNGVRIVRKGNSLTTYFQAWWYYHQLITKPDIVVDMVNTLCWQTPWYVPFAQRFAYVNQLAKEVFFYELPQPLSTICYWLEKFEYLPYKNTRFICYSKSTKADLVSFGIPASRIQQFSLGLDHHKYMPGKQKSVAPLFVFVARLVKMKRAELCIRAVAQVIKTHPKAQLAIVGDGPDKLRLQALVHQLRLKKNVTFIDKNAFFIDKKLNDPKVQLMQQAWALLLPAVKEGWGMVVTEAAACGTPAIVSNVTGLKDSVINHKTGLILSANPSALELAAAMEKIIVQKKFRQKLSQAAISWSKKFNWDTSYQQFKKIILP